MATYPNGRWLAPRWTRSTRGARRTVRPLHLPRARRPDAVRGVGHARPGGPPGGPRDRPAGAGLAIFGGAGSPTSSARSCRQAKAAGLDALVGDPAGRPAGVPVARARACGRRSTCSSGSSTTRTSAGPTAARPRRPPTAELDAALWAQLARAGIAHAAPACARRGTSSWWRPGHGSSRPGKARPAGAAGRPARGAAALPLRPQGRGRGRASTGATTPAAAALAAADWASSRAAAPRPVEVGGRRSGPTTGSSTAAPRPARRARRGGRSSGGRPTPAARATPPPPGATRPAVRGRGRRSPSQPAAMRSARLDPAAWTIGCWRAGSLTSIRQAARLASPRTTCSRPRRGAGRRRRPAGRSPSSRVELVEDAQVRLGGQPVAVAEVGVDERPRDAGGVGHVVDGERRDGRAASSCANATSTSCARRVSGSRRARFGRRPAPCAGAVAGPGPAAAPPGGSSGRSAPHHRQAPATASGRPSGTSTSGKWQAT